MTKRPTQWFGPKTLKKDPRIPSFGVLLYDRKAKTFGAAFLEKEMVTFTSEKQKDTWELLTSSDTPALWYTYDLGELFYSLILHRDVLPPHKLAEKIISPQAEEIDKITITPKGESDALRLAVHQEKRARSSKRLRDLTIINAENYYNRGLPGLMHDFQTPLSKNSSDEPPDVSKASLRDLLPGFWYGMANVHLWTLENLGVKLGVTWSSTVFNAMQTKYLEDSVPKLDKKVEEFIQPAFVGGKTELYRMVQDDAKCYDNNGLYGAAYSLQLPIKNWYYLEGDQLDSERLLGMKDLGFVDWDFYVPEDSVRGPIPVHDESRGLVYPVGHVRSTKRRPIRHFTPLVEEAVNKHGVKIEKINFGVFFKTSKQALRPWAERTAELKEKATTVGERKLASSAMQLVYGKFAQKEERQIVHLGSLPADRRSDPLVSIISDDLPIWLEMVEKPLSNHLPQIAAAITGWAHVIMLRDFARAEEFGCHICYTDTDSMFLDKYLPKDMVGTSLGTYKLVHDHVLFRGLAPKLYFLSEGSKIVAKARGIPLPELKVDDIEGMLRGEKRTFEWERSPTILESVVMKQQYESSEEAEELFKDVIKSYRKKEARSVPGDSRVVHSVLEYDRKRVQLNLRESRPLKAKGKGFE